jgi:hypothetical protein
LEAELEHGEEEDEDEDEEGNLGAFKVLETNSFLTSLAGRFIDDDAYLSAAAMSLISSDELTSEERESPWNAIIRRYTMMAEEDSSANKKKATSPAVYRDHPIADFFPPTTNDAPLWKVTTRVRFLARLIQYGPNRSYLFRKANRTKPFWL